ncbi:MAG: serine/threonine-protein kinase [Mariprofundaceae bacterium]|nr:serine/threonine-protein kinase [Mariprofundaceae bacterium]
MKSSIFKAGWIPGLLLTIVFSALILVPSKPLQTLEFKAYDLAARQSTLAADSNIVIIGVDHASVRDFGRWPWPRSIIARGIDKLTAANAQLVVADFQFENTTYSPELARLANLQVSSMEGREIVQQLRSLNEDQQLINAMQGNGRVLMPLSLRIHKKFAADSSNVLPQSLQELRVNGLMDDKMDLLSSGMLSYPFDSLTLAVKGLGFDTVQAGRDGVLRGAPLLLRYGDATLPSLPLIAAVRLNNLSVRDIHQDNAGSIGVGALSLKIDQQARFYPVFHSGESDVGYRYISFKTLLEADFPLQSLNHKIVLIGLNDGKTEPSYATPLTAMAAPIVFQANVLQSIIDETYVSRPSWFKWIELGLLLLCGAFLMFIFPRFHILLGGTIAVVLAVFLVVTTVILLMFKMIWLQLVTVSLFVLLGSVLVVLWRLITDIPSGGSAESAEQNKMLGLSFQSQGMLDMAFDKLRSCPANEDILLHLYNLALDFERKRQLDKAGNVYEYILSHNSDYKDARIRIDRLNSLMEGSSSATGSMGASGMDTLLVAGGTKPTLGRYEIVKELGKGAMGIVYLGRDPKINRYVAIKTMSLTQEFEADDVEEVKSRFFREAKTAGMLSHPNIVTMFDVGEEHDLAYIAMEFLDGSDLAPYTKKGKLFPPQATLKICGKVAEALHVAHAQSVIHRDIKPANIMLLKDKTVKVTDFGIARISAASKTKSGVVLGTPSYMSPEQLSGKHIDGRSDLFSLGVMMYEMLSGVRPFRGDSMATLMFQIANEPHPDVREHCEAATESTAKLIDRMLAKDPEARIPNGAEVIRGIIQCLRDMNR